MKMLHDSEYWTAKIASGELISGEALRIRLGESRCHFHVLRSNGSIFSVEVGESDYFPSFFALEPCQHARLLRICRVLFPAPPRERFVYLTSSHAILGGCRPLDCLADETRFKLLMSTSQEWADAWHQTSVRAYDGMHRLEPDEEAVIFSAAKGIDPRDSLWSRCIAAVKNQGLQYERNLKEKPELATVFVWQQAIGYAVPEIQAKLYIEVRDAEAFVRIEEVTHRNFSVQLGGARNTGEVLHTVFSAFEEATKLGR